MARDFIKIDTAMAGATHAGLLRAYVQQLRTAYETGTRVKAIMLHNKTDVPLNFADVEALFGLPPGAGQIVFDLVNGSVGSMEGAFQTDDAKDITEKVG